MPPDDGPGSYSIFVVRLAQIRTGRSVVAASRSWFIRFNGFIGFVQGSFGPNESIEPIEEPIEPIEQDLLNLMNPLNQ